MSPLRRLGAAFLTAVLAAQLLTACGPAGNSSAGGGGLRWEDLEYDHSLELQYAQQFSVDYYQGGYALVEIRETGTCAPHFSRSWARVSCTAPSNFRMSSASDIICAQFGMKVPPFFSVSKLAAQSLDRRRHYIWKMLAQNLCE